MWIVKVALNRPYTFIVRALLILIAAPVVILRTPTDIFPNINIPVVSIGWQYTGLNPEELEGRVTSPCEKALTTLVDNIEHIESSTYNGVAVVKVFLQPGASLDTANAQVTAASQFMLRQLPPGILPRKSSTSPPPACPSCNSAFPEKVFLKRSSTTMPPILFERSLSLYPAPWSLRLMGASNGRSASIWIRQPCSRKGLLPETC